MCVNYITKNNTNQNKTPKSEYFSWLHTLTHTCICIERGSGARESAQMRALSNIWICFSVIYLLYKHNTNAEGGVA